MENQNLKFEQISHFISYNKSMRGADGNSITINVNIPEMSDKQLIGEVESVCNAMQKCMNVIEGKVKQTSAILAATVGAGNNVSPHEASRQFEKGFGILCKLNNEVVIRGIAEEVCYIVQKTLGRKTGVESVGDEDQLMLGM